MQIASVTSDLDAFEVTPASAMISPSSSQKFYVTFTPTCFGVKSGYIIFSDNSATSPDTVPVDGSAIATELSVCPRELHYGGVVVGTSQQDSVFIANPTEAAEVISSVVIDNPMFTVTVTKDTVFPSEIVQIDISFTPLGVGDQHGTVVFSFEGLSQQETVAVSGSGVAPFYWRNPSAIAFGNVPVGLTRIDSLNVANPGTAVLHIGSVISDNPSFSVEPSNAAIPPGSNRWFHVTFTPSGFDPRAGKLVISHDAAGSPDSINVTGKGILAIHAQGGWNMLSVPYIMSDYRKTFIFPQSSSPAFRYEGIYLQAETLQRGFGYWLRFESPAILGIDGLPAEIDTIPVRKGWNLIGSQSNSIPVTGVTSSPPGMIVSEFFVFNTLTSSYEVTDSIRPGAAHWIKATQEGKLVLQSIGIRPTAERVSILPEAELPPPPPDGKVNPLLGTRIPLSFALEQNYPNPFNPSTLIRYSLPVDTYVTLKVYSILGQEVATLVDARQDAGYKSVDWNASNWPSGIYIYRLTSGSFVESKQVLLLK